MVPRVRVSKQPKQFQRTPLQFIETSIVHQFPTRSPEEIERMLRVTDVSQTRVFQKALQEDLEKGREEGIEKGIESVALRTSRDGPTRRGNRAGHGLDPGAHPQTGQEVPESSRFRRRVTDLTARLEKLERQPLESAYLSSHRMLNRAGAHFVPGSVACPPCPAGSGPC